MESPDKIKELRAKMIDLLERARALAERTGDTSAGVFIQTARDRIRNRPVSCAGPPVRFGRRQLAG
jgi:hypothetical protein